jgi:hypothetical protein
MAEFNETLRERSPSFINYSKGTSGDRSSKIALEGLGDAIGGVAGALDTNIKDNIKDDLDTGVFDVYDEFGVGAQASVDADVNTAQSPQEIQQAGQTLERLNNAYQGGNLSQTNFNARLVSITRQLKGKYPGYEEDVDDMIRARTGINPESALQRSLMQDRSAALSASNTSAKARQSLELKAAEFATPAEAVEIPSLSSQDLQMMVITGESAKAEAARLQMQMEIADGQDERNLKELQKQGVQMASQNYYNQFMKSADSMTRQAGMGNSLVDAISRATKDGVMETGEANEIRGIWDNLKLAVAQQNEMMLDKNFPQLDTDARKQIREDAELKLAIYEEFLFGKPGKSAGLLRAQSEILKEAKAGILLQILTGQTSAGVLMTMRDVLGDDLVTQQLSSQPGRLLEAQDDVETAVSLNAGRAVVEKQAKQDQTGRIDPDTPDLTDTITILKGVRQYPDLGKWSTDRVVRELISDRFKLAEMAGDTHDSQRLRNEVGALFAGENGTAWYSRLNQADRKAVIRSLLTEKFIKHTKSAFGEDSAVWQNARRFMIDEIRKTNIDEIRVLDDVVSQDDIKFTLIYDKDTQTLTYEQEDKDTDYAGDLFSFNRAQVMEGILPQSLQDALVPINQSIKKMDAVLEGGAESYVESLTVGPNAVPIEGLDDDDDDDEGPSAKKQDHGSLSNTDLFDPNVSVLSMQPGGGEDVPSPK